MRARAGEDAERNLNTQIEEQLASWGVPRNLSRELAQYHTKLSYAPGDTIFSQNSPGDILFWVARGIVKESCRGPRGAAIVVRLATTGDILGIAAQLTASGQWTRRFEAQAVTKCVLAIVTREHVRRTIKSLGPDALADLAERMNSAWAGWVQYYAMFLGLGFRDRLELVLAELGSKFGVPDRDGILLTYEPSHRDLAQMVGSSRPMVSRLMAKLVAERKIERRGPRYILLAPGSIAAAAQDGPASSGQPRVVGANPGKHRPVAA
ncbi:MAG TPA: Crp/Fnr family transcriptional regulator [Candidatus Binataceae bacterium]|nr:Crp/Fnr family transcriptional regulator [Candidatus Binataceae bacterium]